MNKYDNIAIFLLLIVEVTKSFSQPSNMVVRQDKLHTMHFNELTIDDEGDYLVDVDFDNKKDLVSIEHGNVNVYQIDLRTGCYENVSEQIPYCKLRAHSCCPAHRAYITINYIEHTLYTEAHYGYSGKAVHQFKKIGDDWIEINPTKPLSIMQAYLYPRLPVGWVLVGRHRRWIWTYDRF